MSDALPESWSSAGAILLVSCYELGRQPLNLASPAGQLQDAGFGVRARDTSLDPVTSEELQAAALIAISVPMHTALRLGIELAKRIRREAPQAHICFYGLYASLNAKYLVGGDYADTVTGGEVEVALAHLARQLAKLQPTPNERIQLTTSDTIEGVSWHMDQLTSATSIAPPVLRKLPFVVPSREQLPPLDRYAHLIGPEPDQTRTAAYVEASRGCLHQCRHCPISPVYQGRFFIVPHDIVMADAEQQIARGATHITFGDPDFFNGPKHGMRLLEELHAAHPELSFDVTIKVEHLLRYQTQFARLPELGCLFVISAIESLSDEVLARLDKGHTRRDITTLLDRCRAIGLGLRPTLVAFTPWTSLDDYITLIDWLLDEQLCDSVDPIQLGIRLLVPPGSLLTQEPSATGWLGPLDEDSLGHRWNHPDPRVDELFDSVSSYLSDHAGGDALQMVIAIRQLAYAAAGRTPTRDFDSRSYVRSWSPRMSESWFCCAEPNAAQFAAAQSSNCCPVPSVNG